ncbi:hypothetical protein N7456_006700 [Penicillium angulare]|uniref:SET domain-containing protein n=1 Tax=Penicillium angulare TaxID=116970 RepID=A0A9W9KC69_9EURO|nr:hypothetical protein N7456_006700 [Penicillium angulare]
MSQSVRSGTSSETTAKNYPSCGLWPWAAQMKHSCDSNVRYSFINDMMIVRAARNIPRDTELTIWHQSPLITEQIDKRMVIPRLNFECNCPVCTDILNTSKKGSRKRARLRLEILSTLNCVKPDTEKVEDLLAEIEKTFVKPVHESRRFALWELYHKLAEVYLSRARRPKMVECLLKSLEALGFIIENAIIPNTRRLEVKKWGIAIPNTVLTWILISLYYKYEGYKDKEKQAAEYARITYRICIGEDDTFDQYHSAYFMFSQSTET